MTDLDELETALGSIDDPVIGEDIVSLGLVEELSIEDGVATITFAFNTPFSPAELEIGRRVREVLDEAGLEANLRAYVGEEHGFDEEVMPEVRNIIAVTSGKGGVGKTTIAANLAAGLQAKGAHVGLLDADIYGPNVPRILPTDSEIDLTADERLLPAESDGVKLISMSYLLEDQDDPAIIRGPIINQIMGQFMNDVVWEDLDYLIVDLPPGTGDASLNLLQTLPVNGAVIVTTPQQMAVDDTKKGLRMFQEHDVPIVGIVENMSGFRCPTCDDVHDLFGKDGGVDISEEYGVPLVGSLPLHPDFGREGETPVAKDETSPVHETMLELVDAIADRLGEINRRTVAEHVGDVDEAVD